MIGVERGALHLRGQRSANRAVVDVRHQDGKDRDPDRSGQADGRDDRDLGAVEVEHSPHVEDVRADDREQADDQAQ